MRSGIAVVRLLAVGILVLIAVFWVLRLIAAGCTGSGCDEYIPFSLLIPALTLAMVAIAGGLATARARRGSSWIAVLLISTLPGVVGPPVSLLIFSENPDAFVVVATALELLVAFAVLGYSFSPGANGPSTATRPMTQP